MLGFPAIVVERLCLEATAELLIGVWLREDQGEVALSNLYLVDQLNHPRHTLAAIQCQLLFVWRGHHTV